jgi:hypothetical protein
MKLELKNIAPYFPYGIKVQLATPWDNESIKEIVGLSAEHVELIMSRPTDTEYFEFTDIKLILKSISEFCETDLKQIIEYISSGYWCDAYENYFEHWFNDACNTEKLILQAPQEIFNYFLENHYDVFGLIGEGFAISIHDINN